MAATVPWTRAIVRRQKADEGNEQQACVQCRVAERLDKRVLLGVVPTLAHFLMNRRPNLSPALEGPIEPEFLDRAHRAIERDPRHHLRMREVARTASHFPDALVGISPDFLEVRDQRALQRPGRLAGGETRAARDVKGVEHFAVDVELELFDRAVADSDRSTRFRSPAAREFHIPRAVARPRRRRASGGRPAPLPPRAEATRATPSPHRESQPQSAHRG